MSNNKRIGVQQHPYQETSADILSNASNKHYNTNTRLHIGKAIEIKGVNGLFEVNNAPALNQLSSVTNKNIPKQIEVTPTFIDKITLTVDIPVKDRDSIISFMKNDNTYRGGSKRYRHSVIVPLNDQCLPYLNADRTGQTHLRIEADSRDPSHNFMRFEWNPARVDPVLISDTVAHFLPPLWTYEYLLSIARITRLDITFDLLNIGIDQLLFYSTRKPVSAVWDKSGSKGGKTLYMGGERSQQRFTVYDKAALIRKNNTQKVPELKEAVPTAEITRVEFVFKPGKSMALFDVPNIKNPFLDLQIYAYPASLNDKGDLFIQTIARARYEGLSKAIRALSKPNKKKYLMLLKSFVVDWWDPINTWGQMPHVIDKLMNPLETIQNINEYKEVQL